MRCDVPTIQVYRRVSSSIPLSTFDTPIIECKMSSSDDFNTLLEGVTAHIASRDAQLGSLPTIASPEDVSAAIAALPSSLPDTGLGTQASLSVIHKVLDGCVVGQAGPRYFGFVTGGVTPAAQLADILLSSHDENVQVSLPTTAAVKTEQKALELVLELLGLEGFEGRTITTGATASNVLGMGECILRSCHHYQDGDDSSFAHRHGS